MRDKTATFIGHKDCYGVQEEVVRSYIIELIESGVTEFLCGGMGSFDWMCARIVYKLKKQYPQVRSFLVIPYLTFNVLDREYFDDLIYPEGFEKYHFLCDECALGYLLHLLRQRCSYDTARLRREFFRGQRRRSPHGI